MPFPFLLLAWYVMTRYLFQDLLSKYINSNFVPPLVTIEHLFLSHIKVATKILSSKCYRLIAEL